MVEPTHLKNIRQIGSSLQVRVKIKNMWNHQPNNQILSCSHPQDDVKKMLRVSKLGAPKKLMGLPRYHQLWLHFNWVFTGPSSWGHPFTMDNPLFGHRYINLNFIGPPPSLHHRHPSETTASSHSTRAASVIERAIFGGGRCGVSKRFQKDGFGGCKMCKAKKRSSKSKRFKYQDKPRMIHENFGQFSKLSSRGSASKSRVFLGSKHLRIPNPPHLAALFVSFRLLLHHLRWT